MNAVPGTSTPPEGSWPTAAQFNAAIQNLSASMGDEELRQGEPVVNAMGIPMPYSGGFADVYEVRCPATGNTWAVKCFTKGAAGLHDRYEAVSQRLDQVKLSFMVDFSYLDEGVRISGAWYPIVKMRWIEGKRLNEYVAETLENRRMLEKLFQLWLKLSDRLRKAKIAHADLQHGNVLLVPKDGNLALRLIDYDGMYVPALDGRSATEAGHPNFQHPQRAATNAFSKELDRFPHLAICSAIRCLQVGGQRLWERFDNGENLLFSNQDFQRPSESKLFRELLTLPDANANALVGHLALSTRQPLDKTPLMSELVNGSKVKPLSSDQKRQVRALLEGNGKRSTVAVVQPEPAALDDGLELELADLEETIERPTAPLADTASLEQALATSPFKRKATQKHQAAGESAQASPTSVTLQGIDATLKAWVGGNELMHNLLRAGFALGLVVVPCVVIYAVVQTYALVLHGTAAPVAVAVAEDPTTPDSTDDDASSDDDSVPNVPDPDTPLPDSLPESALDSSDPKKGDNQPSQPEPDRSWATRMLDLNRDVNWLESGRSLNAPELGRSLIPTVTALVNLAKDPESGAIEVFKSFSRLGFAMCFADIGEEDFKPYAEQATLAIKSLPAGVLQKLGEEGASTYFRRMQIEDGWMVFGKVDRVVEEGEFVRVMIEVRPRPGSVRRYKKLSVLHLDLPAWRLGLEEPVSDIVGSEVLVLGCMVRDPRKQVIGFAESDRQVPLAGFYVTIPKSPEPETLVDRPAEPEKSTASTDSPVDDMAKPSRDAILPEEDLAVTASSTPTKLAYQLNDGERTVEESSVTRQGVGVSSAAAETYDAEAGYGNEAVPGMEQARIEVTNRNDAVLVITTDASKRRVTESYQSLKTSTLMSGSPGMSGEYGFDSATPDTRVSPASKKLLSTRRRRKTSTNASVNQGLEEIRPFHKALAKSQRVTTFDHRNEVLTSRLVGKGFSSLKPKLKNQVDIQFDPKWTKEKAIGVLKRLPTDEVRSGDTWQAIVPADFGHGFATPEMTVTWQYTYDGTVDRSGETLHRITGVVVKHDYDPRSSPSNTRMTDLKITDSHSVLFFDNNKGRFVLSCQLLAMQFTDSQGQAVAFALQGTSREKSSSDGGGTPAAAGKQAADSGGAKALAQLGDPEFLKQNKTRVGVTVLPNGLQYEVLELGTGKSPSKDDRVTLHLQIGRRNQPPIFKTKANRLATPYVRDLLPDALTRMSVGDKWRIYVPPTKAAHRGSDNTFLDIGLNNRQLMVVEVTLLNIFNVD